jgi:hypothetical protein
MRWPFGTKTDDVQPPAIEPDWSEPVARQSPGMRAVFERLREEDRYRVLDLGPAVGANFEIFAGFAHHIRIVDLLGEGSPAHELAELEDEQLERAVRRLLPEHWGQYDLVFAWDLLNHLGEAQARAFVERLATMCSEGASVFLMVVTAEAMAERPLQYRILDQGTLEYRALSPHSVRSPGWPPSTIERMFRGCRIERSFVLRHGVQEYVAIKE